MSRLFGNLLTISVISILLSACGGGGGGSDSASTPPPPTADTNLDWDNGNWDEVEWQ